MNKIHAAIAITLNPLLTAMDRLFPVKPAKIKSATTRTTTVRPAHDEQPLLIPIRQAVQHNRRAG